MQKGLIMLNENLSATYEIALHEFLVREALDLLKMTQIVVSAVAYSP